MDWIDGGLQTWQLDRLLGTILPVRLTCRQRLRWLCVAGGLPGGSAHNS